MSHRTRMLLLLFLASSVTGGCGGDARDALCGQKAPNRASCPSGDYCVCYAGSVAVDEHEFPGCAEPPNETDTGLQLGSGTSGACQPCSYTAYCGAGRTWDAQGCRCQPPLAVTP